MWKGAHSGYWLRLIQNDFMIPENRKISSTEENKADFLDNLNEALDVAEHISDALPETTTQEVQAIRREDGSSSAHPLDVDGPLDVDRNNSMLSAWHTFQNHLSRSSFKIFWRIE